MIEQVILTNHACGKGEDKVGKRGSVISAKSLAFSLAIASQFIDLENDFGLLILVS